MANRDHAVVADAVDAAEPPAPEGGPHTAPAVLHPQRTEPSGAPDPNFALLIEAARDQTFDVAKMERAMAMIKERELETRKRAFFAALALAKGEFGPILKTRVVDYPHKERDDREGGGRTKYKYEELADIAHIVDPVLARHGLSYRHRAKQEKDRVGVSCIVSHAEGHSEEGDAIWAAEDKSGQKNPIQGVTSTVTYLQRATLKIALGLAAGRDDDASGYDDDPMITPDDVVYIESLVRETDSDLPKLLKTVGAERVVEMHASQFKKAAWLLETVKRRDKAKPPPVPAESKPPSEAIDGTAQSGVV
jgi:hypothetical protein